MRKIIELIKKYKLFIILFLILLFLFFLRLVLSKKEPSPELEKPTPLEQKKEIIIPEEIGKKPVSKPEKELQFLSVYPQPGENKTFSSQYKIVFTFDSPPSLESLKFKIKPNISLKASVENEKLSFYPSVPFSFDTSYSLQIETLEGTAGAQLAQPINYQFKLTFPEKIIFKEDH